MIDSTNLKVGVGISYSLIARYTRLEEFVVPDEARGVIDSTLISLHGLPQATIKIHGIALRNFSLPE